VKGQKKRAEGLELPVGKKRQIKSEKHRGIPRGGRGEHLLGKRRRTGFKIGKKGGPCKQPGGNQKRSKKVVGEKHINTREGDWRTHARGKK